MDDKEKELNGQHAPTGTEGVKNSPAPANEVDLADALKSTLDELSKVQKERDNYRTGLLKAKGKLPDDGDEADAEERIRAIAREEFLKSQEGELSKKKDALLEKITKENKELKVAIRSRSQLENKSGVGGGNQEKHEAKPQSYLSDDQKRFLKEKRGWDDKKIASLEDNLKRKGA